MASSRDFNREGTEAYAGKDYAAAVDHFTAALIAAEGSETNDRVPILCNRSKAYVAMGRVALGLDDADAAVSADGLNSAGWRRKAEAHLALRDHEKASSAAERGMKTLPSTPASNATRTALGHILEEAAVFASAPKRKGIKVVRGEPGFLMICAAEGCGKHNELPGITLSKCKRCLAVQYCSKECQKAHWKTHKKACTIQREKNLQTEEDVNAERGGASRELKRSDLGFVVWAREHPVALKCLHVFAYMLQHGLLNEVDDPGVFTFRILNAGDLKSTFRNPEGELQKYLYVEVIPISTYEAVEGRPSGHEGVKKSAVENTIAYMLGVLRRVDTKEGFMVMHQSPGDLVNNQRVRYVKDSATQVGPKRRIPELARLMSQTRSGNKYAVRCALMGETNPVPGKFKFRISLSFLDDHHSW